MFNRHNTNATIAYCLAVSIACLAGCSAITNPVANGIPARLLDDDLLAEPKENKESIPLGWLRVDPPDVYRLDVGDIMGIYIEGALGKRDEVPPINLPQVENVPPSIGFPIPVGEKGDISLPLVNKIMVKGMTLDEAQQEILNAYLAIDTGKEDEAMLKEGSRVLVTLVRPRQARILVIREDSPSQRPSTNDPTFRLFGSAPSLDAGRAQGTGFVLELPETEADVLSALAKSGGLPGPTARNEVIVYRGHGDNAGFDTPAEWNESGLSVSQSIERQTIRIPLQVDPGSPRPFNSEDVRLQSGDIIFVPGRDTDVYYTGGLIPPREVPLPRDADIRVVEAILRAGGSVNNGGVLIGNFTGSNTFLRGLGNPSPSLVTVLRRTPGGGQVPIRVNLNRALRDPRENLLVKPGDVLLMQETPAEAVARYVSQIFNVGIFTNFINRGSAQGNAEVILP